MINCPECNKKMDERIQTEPESTLPVWLEIWLECKECGERNYRTEVNVSGGTPKFELNKFCKRERKRTTHKIRRK